MECFSKGRVLVLVFFPYRRSDFLETQRPLVGMNFFALALLHFFRCASIRLVRRPV